ncbi:MAG: S46 family peptidase [Myxococcales bacterium]|nr:S46 family peptidase [Myxococcales bacterium]
MPSSRSLLLLLPLSLCVLTTSSAQANEGQWKPEQIVDIHPQAATIGLSLDAKALWDPEGDEKTGGLMRASVNLGGCSAAFVSADGLIATNHHCAYGALQANSSVDHDYLKDGFLAATRADELGAPGSTVKVLRTIEDVSAEFKAVILEVEDDSERAQAIEKLQNQLVDACEAAGEHLHCRVASFYMGGRFELHEYVEIQDVRLVYAPPSAIGEYGGETDNWMWPRHTGDFSLLRAYVGPDGQIAAKADDNVPYKPAQFLKPSTDGVSPGDFVAVLGYPGHTDRYMWSSELERHQNLWLPQRVIMYGEWIDILDAAGAKDKAVEIKVAATKKSLANRHKNARGKIAGLERMKLLDERKAEDAKLREGGEEAVATLDALDALSKARSEREHWAFLLENLGYAPRSLAIARDLVEWSGERGKDDLERKSGYRDRDRDRVFSRLEGLVRDHDADVDVELLASFLRYADALPGKRIAGFDKIMGAAKGAGADNLDAYREAARAALEGSALADPEGMKALFEDPAAVAASKDPMIVLARALVGELAELEQIKLAEQGAMARLGPAYFGLLAGLRPQPVYADANSTLRMSYASIKGYAKWNGEEQKPQTVMGGAVAKHVGSGDFNLPAKVLEKAKTAPQSRWADPRLGDLPLCFLADGDTTGGNSGSPVIDGKGQLIGFNFDRVWENVAGDYAWRTEQSRNVVADVRYLYWMLEEVAEAPHLLQELGVADYQPPAKAMTEVKDDVPPPAPGQEKKSGCNCSTGDDDDGGGSLGLLALLALTGAGLRRRSRR